MAVAYNQEDSFQASVYTPQAQPDQHENTAFIFLWDQLICRIGNNVLV